MLAAVLLVSRMSRHRKNNNNNPQQENDRHHGPTTAAGSRIMNSDAHAIFPKWHPKSVFCSTQGKHLDIWFGYFFCSFLFPFLTDTNAKPSPGLTPHHQLMLRLFVRFVRPCLVQTTCLEFLWPVTYWKTTTATVAAAKQFGMCLVGCCFSDSDPSLPA